MTDLQTNRIITLAAKWCMRVLFGLLAIYLFLLFTEGKVKYGRFTGIDNNYIDFSKYFMLLIWAWITFKLFPKERILKALIVLGLSSFFCWFGMDLIETYRRQFFNALLLFNGAGAAMVIFKKAEIRASLLVGFLLLIVLSILIKPLGLATGFTSEHDYVETEIMYLNNEHTLVKSKRTKKGYKNLGVRLEYHDNGHLKFYEDYDAPEGTPWITFHNTGEIAIIRTVRYRTVGARKRQVHYAVSFDDKGLINRVNSSNGPALEYHYNGYVFSSGQSRYDKPYGTWYWYSYEDGSVVDSVLDVAEAPKNWDKRNQFRTNRYRAKDSADYSIRYDQELRNGIDHYRPDSIYEFAVKVREKYEQLE